MGNGVAALTAETLHGLVASTAPFLFPALLREVVDESDEDFEQLMSSESSHRRRESVSGTGSIQKEGDSLAATEHVPLVSLCSSPSGWKEILATRPCLLPAPAEHPDCFQRQDYFALCLAAHFATVATYVPTDVDSKIRGHCWEDPDVEVLRGQFEAAKEAHASWRAEHVSRRTLDIDEGGLSISGHDGEFLGIFAGALCAFTKLGLEPLALEAEALITAELEREVAKKCHNLTRYYNPKAFH